MDLLLKKTHVVLKQGGKIVILGWKTSNHDKFTRKLEETGRVKFYEKDPISICSGSMLIWTRFVGHSLTDRFRNQAGIVSHSRSLNTGEIRRFLRGAGLMKLGEPAPPKVQEPIPIIATERPSELVVKSSVAQTNLVSERAFASDFFESVGQNPSGTLSKFEASRLLRKHFGETAVASRFGRLLEKIVAEGGKKAGYYKATSFLMDLVTNPDHIITPDTSAVSREPEEKDLTQDTVGKLGVLLAKRPALLGERDRLKKELQDVEKQLEKIDRITAVLSEIEV